MNFRTRRRPDDVELNFVPLIDVLVVLLIFLMVTTSFNRVGRLKVELPQAPAPTTAASANTIELSIDAAGRYALGEQTLAPGDVAGLTEALRRAASGRKEPVLVLSVDRNTPHQRVIAAMSAARAAGLQNLSFAVDAAELAP